MSSATSTEAVRLESDTPARDRSDRLQPWQFFVLAALACATAVVFVVRGQGVIPVVLLTLVMGAAALVGLAALRMVRPLVGAHEDRTRVIGHRTRAALEREKMLVLRALKELEFDHAMGKLSEDDFREMGGRLRGRATRLIRQLDAAEGYRQQVERDLAQRLSDMEEAGGDRARKPEGSPQASGASAGLRSCAACSTPNDPDARFCKECGQKL